MRFVRCYALLSVTLLVVPCFGQQSQPAQTSLVAVQRDPQGVSVLQKSVAAMGASLPLDSSASGTVTTVAGGATDQGTIRILTRGTQQTLKEVLTPAGTRTVISSNGEASETVSGTATALPMQRVVTSQCPYFPLPYLAALLVNPDEAFAYLGIENVSGAPAAHIRASNQAVCLFLLGLFIS